MSHKKKLATFLIAMVWFCNGLFCKVLNLVPRHEQIVSIFFGEEMAHGMTILIGVSEILMAAWVLSGIQRRVNTVAQIAIIGAMNCLEFLFASDLLLWGKMNLFFAIGFLLFLYYREFVWYKNKM